MSLESAKMTSVSKRKIETEFHVSDLSRKKAKLLDEDDSSGSEQEVELKVNEAYAERFKHNKERAEKHRRKYIQR
jgi:hypothetical protein